MSVHTRLGGAAVVAGLVVGVTCGSAGAAPPVYTVSSVVKTNDIVPGIGPISGPIGLGGQGILKVSVNNSGMWVLHADTNVSGASTDEVILRSQGGLSPYIREGIPGDLTQPTVDAVPTAFHGLGMNAAGNAVYALGLFTDDFTLTPTSGVYFNKTKLVFQEGNAVNATGLAAGTVWLPLDPNTRVAINDTNQVLVVSMVNESGTAKRAVVLLQLDGTGTITGRTLVAKETGLVGAGPATWTTIAGGAHASGLNNAGKVVFSGTTSGGTNGIYTAPGGFIATMGGATPVAGQVWGTLAGMPVDINTAGVVAFRALTGDSVGSFVETTDAGDVPDMEDHTYGNGAFTQIDGTLSNDQDVDMFRVKVTDAAAFSATTVPAGGFSGAAFDSVLTIIAEPGNGTQPKNRSDNVSAGVVQSTIGGTGLTTGRIYYLCVSTPKSRCSGRVANYSVGAVNPVSGFWSTSYYPVREFWQSDPASVAVNAGLVYWPDPSESTIRRATTGGVIQPDIAANKVSSHIVVDGLNGKLYWADHGAFPPGERIRSSNLDGSSVADVVTGTGFSATNLTGQEVSGLALDLVSVPPKLYWTKSVFGEINRCNLDGSSPERVIQDYGAVDAHLPAATYTATLAPSSIGVDGAGGKVYWINSFVDRIERASLNGTGRASIGVGAGAADLALDLAAGKVYWTNTAANKIQRANLDGSSLEDVLSAPSPVGIALSGGFVYWTNTVDRAIRRSPIVSPVASDVVVLGPDVGQRVPDGEAVGSSFSSWVRVGTAGAAALPYSVKLTGATFEYPLVMLAKSSGQKVAQTGDVLTGITPNKITTVATDTGAVRISDRGDVYWTGSFYAPTIYQNFIFDGVFFNQELLMKSTDTIPGTPSIGTDNMAHDQKLVNTYKTNNQLAISRDGTYALLAVNMQDFNFNFATQRDNALLVRFTLPAVCRADFNGNGSVTVQDIFDFLAAYFSHLPSADFNNSGTVTVQDIFDFLAAWFNHC